MLNKHPDLIFGAVSLINILSGNTGQEAVNPPTIPAFR